MPQSTQEPEPDEIELARAVRLFQARIGEALESSIETLRNDIAAEIVGRELHVAPPDLTHILRRALARYAAEQPVRVRVHPDHLAQVGSFQAIGDPQMRRGDAILELRNGTIDASLGVRLEAVLRAAQ